MGKFKVEIVNCYSLNVRSGPGTSHKVVQWAQKGQQFTSSKQSSGWYYLDSKGGYASGSYIKVIQNLDPPPPPPAPKTPKVVGTLKLTAKSTPAYQNAKVGTVITSFAPQTVNVYVKMPPWYQIQTYKGPLWVNVPAPATAAPPKKPVTNPKPNYDEIRQMLEAGQGESTDMRFQKLSEADKRIPTVAPDAPGLVAWEASTLKPTFGGKDIAITDYTLDYEFIKQNLDIIRKNYNLIGETHNIRNDLFDRFNRFKLAFPDDHLSKTFSHVFFTRPSLNLMDGDKLHAQFENDPLFYFLWNNNPRLIKALTTKLSSSHDFHPYLSNAAKSFDVADEVIKTTEHGETYTGYKLMYGKHNIESNTAGQFSIQYNDDKEYTIYKTHKAWIEYISRVYRGIARPTKNNIKHKILDYASSVYYVICAADGETILFWTKYFGVFPLNAPASEASWQKGSMGTGSPDFTVNYAYAMKEDFSPLSLSEFNMNSSTSFQYKKTYDPIVLGTGRTLSGAPFIESSKGDDGVSVYKLKFRT